MLYLELQGWHYNVTSAARGGNVVTMRSSLAGLSVVSVGTAVIRSTLLTTRWCHYVSSEL